MKRNGYSQASRELFNKYLNRMTFRYKSQVYDDLSSIISNSQGIIDDKKSPIETLFEMALYNLFYDSVTYYDCLGEFNQYFIDSFMHLQWFAYKTVYANRTQFKYVDMSTQHLIKTERGTYRVDYLFIVRRNFNTEPVLSLVIELDGHDFHEKTKEQVKKDKERERAIKKAGYDVIRFSGSEVYKSPESIIIEILAYIDSIVDREEQ